MQYLVSMIICILNKIENTLFKRILTNLTQLVTVYKGHMSDKTTMPKSFKLDQAFMNNVEKS